MMVKNSYLYWISGGGMWQDAVEDIHREKIIPYDDELLFCTLCFRFLQDEKICVVLLS